MGLTINTKYALLTMREALLNEMPTDMADYSGIVPANPQAFFPNMVKTSNKGRGGREFANERCNGYWENHRFNLQVPANFSTAGQLLLRFFGGQVDTTVAGRTAGTKQVETLTVTALDAITADGSLTVTVTAAGMPGSPYIVHVPVLDGDSDTTIAAKIRAALQADGLVGNEDTGMFVITGTVRAIIATKNVAAANDGTVNFALATGTATGVTAVANSANTTAGVAGTAANWYHEAAMLAVSAGYQLDSMALAIQNEADSFVIGGIVVNQFTLSQQGSALPVLTVDLVSTGIGALLEDEPPDSEPDPACLDGGATRIIYTDKDGVTHNLPQEVELREWTVTGSNNTVTDPLRTQRPGDPKWGITDGLARYVRTLKHGDRSITGQMTIAFSTTIEWWESMCRNDEITDLTFEVNGARIGGYPQQLGVKVPIARVLTTQGADSQGDAAYIINFEADEDPVTSGGALGFCTNDIEDDFE